VDNFLVSSHYELVVVFRLRKFGSKTVCDDIFALLTTTTNTLDGSFSHLKQKVNTYCGINLEAKKKTIETSPSIPSKQKNKNSRWNKSTDCFSN